MENESIIIEKTGSSGVWEGCIDSVNYRIERGVRVTVPKELAELIRRSEVERRRREALEARFCSGNGARLA